MGRLVRPWPAPLNRTILTWKREFSWGSRGRPQCNNSLPRSSSVAWRPAIYVETERGFGGAPLHRYSPRTSQTIEVFVGVCMQYRTSAEVTRFGPNFRITAVEAGGGTRASSRHLGSGGGGARAIQRAVTRKERGARDRTTRGDTLTPSAPHPHTHTHFRGSQGVGGG